MGTASGRSGDEASAAPAGLAPALALAQGAYYLLTGVWPLVSIGTFQRLTGPKADRWLVKTVGVLVGALAAWALTGLHEGHGLASGAAHANVVLHLGHHGLHLLFAGGGLMRPSVRAFVTFAAGFLGRLPVVHG